MAPRITKAELQARVTELEKQNREWRELLIKARGTSYKVNGVRPTTYNEKWMKDICKEINEAIYNAKVY
jgi:hypothetical protein